MPFPKPKFEEDKPREKVQKGRNIYPTGRQMAKGSKLTCLGCKGRGCKGCKGCKGNGYIEV